MHDSHTQQQSTDADDWWLYCVQSAMRNVKEVFEKFDTVSYSFHPVSTALRTLTHAVVAGQQRDH